MTTSETIVIYGPPLVLLVGGAFAVWLNKRALSAKKSASPPSPARAADDLPQTFSAESTLRGLIAEEKEFDRQDLSRLEDAFAVLKKKEHLPFYRRMLFEIYIETFRLEVLERASAANRENRAKAG